jgi:hypothetical protein
MKSGLGRRNARLKERGMNESMVIVGSGSLVALDERKSRVKVRPCHVRLRLRLKNGSGLDDYQAQDADENIKERGEISKIVVWLTIVMLLADELDVLERFWNTGVGGSAAQNKLADLARA